MLDIVPGVPEDGRGGGVRGVDHGPHQAEHPEQNQPELVILPTVDDDVGAGV